MTIYFSHGKDSSPTGRKINYLTPLAKELGFSTKSIDYTMTKDPDVRVQILFDYLQKEKDDVILYGSSMGAYVSLVVSELIPVKGLFLCAPALYLENYNVQRFQKQTVPITIIHGKEDMIVPYLNSVRFAEKHNCELHAINDGHLLSRSENIIQFLFSEFLSKLNQIQ